MIKWYDISCTTLYVCGYVGDANEENEMCRACDGGGCIQGFGGVA